MNNIIVDKRITDILPISCCVPLIGTFGDKEEIIFVIKDKSSILNKIDKELTLEKVSLIATVGKVLVIVLLTKLTFGNGSYTIYESFINCHAVRELIELISKQDEDKTLFLNENNEQFLCLKTENSFKRTFSNVLNEYIKQCDPWTMEEFNIAKALMIDATDIETLWKNVKTAAIINN